ncbi:hypothetical protein D3C81_1693120 [compost metagenome]
MTYDQCKTFEDIWAVAATKYGFDPDSQFGFKQPDGTFMTTDRIINVHIGYKAGTTHGTYYDNTG